jgi:periplasmic protein TonB
MGYQALLFCPDEKAARGVTQVLSELDFSVEPCTEPFAAVKKLMAQHFDAIVVDCDNEQNATLLFKSARNSTSNQSSLAVAVVEGQAGVAKAFRIGANLVLTKPINVEQAKGTLRVARGLLRKGGDPHKPAVDQSATPASSAAPSSPTGPAAKPLSPARPAPAPSVGSVPSSSPAKSWPASPKTAPQHFQKTDEKLPKSAPEIAAEAPSKPAGSPKVEVTKLAKPAATATQPSAPQTKYPWQATKPGAEPMASALKKAAEAAGIAPPPPTESIATSVPEIGAAPVPTMSGSAAAPAPAKEKPAPVASPAVPVVEKPFVETKPAVEPAPRLVQTPEPKHRVLAEETPAPSFSMGAPAFDEEEPPNSKKAVLILAIVVVLASLAGYLGWKNMSDKSPTKTPSPQLQAPAAQPSTGGSPSSSDSVTPTTTSPVSSPSISDSVVTAQPAKPSAKMIAKDSTKSVAPAPSAPSDTQPVSPTAPALVVHNENSRPVSKQTASDSNEPPAPSALGLTSSADPNALSAISNAPVAVPKASSQIVRVSQGVSEGLILKKVQPRYPAQAMQMHIEGPVQMQATVSKDGSISNVKILSGDPVLARAAQEAVRQWKYKPYYLDGEPVDIQTQITINFRLPK